MTPPWRTSLLACRVISLADMPATTSPISFQPGHPNQLPLLPPLSTQNRLSPSVGFPIQIVGHTPYPHENNMQTTKSLFPMLYTQIRDLSHHSRARPKSRSMPSQTAPEPLGSSSISRQPHHSSLKIEYKSTSAGAEKPPTTRCRPVGSSNHHQPKPLIPKPFLNYSLVFPVTACP
jgi:hypothetical protein